MTPIVSAAILRAQSDERLLTLARQGYERAFEAIVERYRRPMMRYCRRYLPEARAEDAVQQAFMSAWSAIRDGTEVTDLRAWLYRITRNAAIDAAKRAGYDYHELGEALRLTPGPEAEVERRAVMRETLTGVATLPDTQREALLRTVVEGQSRADIARDMRISEGAVRQLVHRARMTLRSAVTSLTPAPLIGWAASLGSPDAPISVRIAELAAGGGAAGGAALVVKIGTVIAVAGALAVETGARLNHPAAAAGDPASGGRGKPATLAAAFGSAEAGTNRRRRSPASPSGAAASTSRRARDTARRSGKGSRGSKRGPGSLVAVAGTVAGSGGAVQRSSGHHDDNDDGDDDDNRAPVTQTTAAGDVDAVDGSSGSDGTTTTADGTTTTAVGTTTTAVGEGETAGSDASGSDSEGDTSGSDGSDDGSGSGG